MGRSPGGSHGNPLQNSCLGNPLDRGAWQAARQWVPKSQTPLKRLSMRAGMHSQGNWDDAVCTVGGLGCLVLLMPRQYCQTCPASPQPSVHTRHVHTHELCMEPVTDAAVVTGAPQPDPLLPRRPSGGPRSTSSSRLSGTSRSRAPLCHTTDLRGPPPRRPFQAAPEEGLSQLLPPPGTAEESPSVRSALSEMPLGNSC